MEYRKNTDNKGAKIQKNTEKIQKKRDEIQNFLRLEKLASEAEPWKFRKILVLKPQE